MKGKRGSFVDDDGVSDPALSEDEDFSRNDKLLLEKHRRNMQKQAPDSEEELFGFDESDDEAAKMDESDIEGASSDVDLPDIRAWGQQKKNFYSTDYVDQDYGGLGAQEEEAAEMEEAEARNIQKRLADELKDTDFSLDIFNITTDVSKAAEEERGNKEHIKKDLGKLSRRQKLELLQKESPELAGIVSEFKECLTQLDEQFQPLMDLLKDSTIPACEASSYIETKYHILINYCFNLSFYLMLKARHTWQQSHPIIRRLVQYRQMLDTLEKNAGPSLEKQIHSILELAIADEAYTQPPASPKKKLLSAPAGDSKRKNLAMVCDRESERMTIPLVSKHSDDDSSQEEEDEKDRMADEVEEGKRAITYQIAKNKGLIPYRKKELRNPRVKHRMKFRKAKIRRKGQVREVRSELQKYGGEISGIKIGVSKSIKFK